MIRLAPVSTMMRAAVTALLIAPTAPVCRTVAAQVTTTPDGRTSIPRDTANTHKTLFTYRDAALAAGFVGLTVAMFPLDKRIARSLQNENAQANKFFDKSAKGVELITSPGAFVI